MKKMIAAALFTTCAIQAIPVQTEIKLGNFRFGDSTFRRIYRQYALDTQITASVPVWKFLRIYGGLNYISREGRSVGGHYKTEIMILPVSLGLQAMIDIAHDVKYYATVGPRYFYVHQNNHFKGVDRTVNGHNIGGFVNTGFLLYFGSHFFIDLFGEYSYCKIEFHSHKRNVIGSTRQVGGLTLGGGLGYQF